MSHSSVCAKTNWHLLEGAVNHSGKLLLIYCYQDCSVMNTVSSICFCLGIKSLSDFTLLD